MIFLIQVHPLPQLNIEAFFVKDPNQSWIELEHRLLIWRQHKVEQRHLDA